MKTIFFITLLIQYLMILGVLWSILLPQKRVWPPADKSSWQYVLTWILFCSVTLGKLAVIALDWNTWIIPDEVRFYLGIPIILVGAYFAIWGIKTLGLKNTGGESFKFIYDGPYRFTRNPQYLGDMAIYGGLILLSNSFHVMVLQSIAILVFLLTPLTEELWWKNYTPINMKTIGKMLQDSYSVRAYLKILEKFSYHTVYRYGPVTNS